MFYRLHENAAAFRKLLKAELPASVRLEGPQHSPLVHARLTDGTAPEKARAVLAAASEKARENGVLVYSRLDLPQEQGGCDPSLRICVNADHSNAQLAKAAKIL